MRPYEEEFAADMLEGADEIAFYLYGNRKKRRKIYHLVATSHLPVFKLGSMICARRVDRHHFGSSGKLPWPFPRRLPVAP